MQGPTPAPTPDTKKRMHDATKHPRPAEEAEAPADAEVPAEASVEAEAPANANEPVEEDKKNTDESSKS